MPSVASNIRITPDANRLLTGLSKRLSRPKAQVVELALRQFEQRVFWADVQKAFAEGESAELAAERKLWDTTTPDGLSKEPW